MIKGYKLLILIVCITMMLATTGVYATWLYTGVEDTGSLDQTVSVGLLDFEYAPEEVLPGDEEADKVGENHLSLIYNIVNHITYGLNATSKPIVRELLEDGEGEVYSQQKVQGGNLKHMMITGSTMEKLEFVVQYYSDTEYIAYTYNGLQATKYTVGTTIEVYKTVIVYENGKWDDVRSYVGKAEVVSIYKGNHSFYAINVKSWVET